jgi:hypothetical protein
MKGPLVVLVHARRDGRRRRAPSGLGDRAEVRVATGDAEEGFAPTAARRQERDAVEAKNLWKRLAPPAEER